MNVVYIHFQSRGFSILRELVVELLFDLFDHFLDSSRVNATVRDQLLDRHLRNFAPNRVKARNDNGFGSVVNDQIASGGNFQRTDVSPLPANDAALHFVAGQIDDRHG